MKKSNFIHINIGRQIGAGGLELAQRLSKELDIKVFDKELITLAAKESGLDKNLFAKADESDNLGLNNSFSLSSFVEAVQTGFGANYISGGRLFKIQSEVIKKLANEGSTIFIGRCADYILRDYPNCLNIFITANMNDRIKRIRSAERITDAKSLSDEKIESLLNKGDRQRSIYYSDYSFKKWGYAESYDITFNSSLFSMDEMVTIIKNYIDSHLK